MDHELLRRIVRIEARFETGESKVGTGFRIGPGQVLTAQHLVERGSKTAIEIEVRLDPDGSGENVRVASAEVIWKGEERLNPKDPRALDAVLLADELPGEDLAPFRDWVPLPLGRSGHWETRGFATANPNARALGTEYLWGVCHPSLEQATHLQLTVERDPPRFGRDGEFGTWAGVSGGPVFVKDGRYQDYLYGVVRSSPKRFPDTLYAVGTPALLRNAELRRLLGFKDQPPPDAGLVERLRSLLEEDSRLTERLAGFEAAWKSRWTGGGTDDLVDVICREGRLKPALERLRDLYRVEEASSAGAARLQEMAIVLVSILASREVPGGEHLDVESTRRIQLGTASPNFAEALLASAYGQSSLFEEARAPDLPHAYLRVPTGNMEAGLRTQSQVGEQLEELLLELLERDLDRPKFILPAQKALFSGLAPGKRREMLTKMLRKSLTRLEERHGRPAYLVAGGELEKKMGGQLDRFLRRLAVVLPNLDLVVLETDADKVEQAIDQEDMLWPLWEILDLLPDLEPG